MIYNGIIYFFKNVYLFNNIYTGLEMGYSIIKQKRDIKKYCILLYSLYSMIYSRSKYFNLFDQKASTR